MWSFSRPQRSSSVDQDARFCLSTNHTDRAGCFGALSGAPRLASPFLKRRKYFLRRSTHPTCSPWRGRPATINTGERNCAHRYYTCSEGCVRGYGAVVKIASASTVCASSKVRQPVGRVVINALAVNPLTVGSVPIVPPPAKVMLAQLFWLLRVENL